MPPYPWKTELKALGLHLVVAPPRQVGKLFRAFWAFLKELRSLGTLAWVGVPPLLALIYFRRSLWALIAAAFIVLMAVLAIVQSGAHRHTYAQYQRRKFLKQAQTVKDTRIDR